MELKVNYREDVEKFYTYLKSRIDDEIKVREILEYVYNNYQLK